MPRSHQQATCRQCVCGSAGFRSRIRPGELEKAIVEIVHQLKGAPSVVTAPEEREQLAEFNLLAG
jgi:hypothetical protein